MKTQCPTSPLRILRESRSVSRKALAAHLGVSTVTICRYENGTRSLPVRQAMRIGQFFSVPWSSLYVDHAP